MASNKYDFGLPAFDSLFSTEEERQESNKEKVVKIPIDKIRDFNNHPFKVRMDDDMVKLIDSINENGVLMPVLVRPIENGEYEMIAGHRRKFASIQLGLEEVEAIVKNLDDNQSTILMVDSNIQREKILPTERGYAYKMRLDAMKNQGKRSDLTSSQLGTKYKTKRTDQTLAELVGESKNQIHRYIRLTELIKPLQEMVDGIHELDLEIAFLPAYELSFLKKENQEVVVNVITETLATPSLSQAKHLRWIEGLGDFTNESVEMILNQEKPNQKEKLNIKKEDVSKYFPKDYTVEQMTEVIVKLLEKWQKKRERDQYR